MTDWSQQCFIEDVETGMELPSISMPITLQRLVMEAGANRDLSLIHHDREVARSTGAPDAYMNTFFIVGMIERMLREWMGTRGAIRKIASLRMMKFNAVGDLVTVRGTVSEVADDGTVSIDVETVTDSGTTVTALAQVKLPSKG